MSDPSRADTGNASTPTDTTPTFPTDAEVETIRRALRALGQRPTIQEAIAANVARINELLRPFLGFAADAPIPMLNLKNGWRYTAAQGLHKPNEMTSEAVDLGSCALPGEVIREVLSEMSKRALRLAASEEARLRVLAAAVNALTGQPIDVPRVVEPGGVPAVPQGTALPGVGSLWHCGAHTDTVYTVVSVSPGTVHIAATVGNKGYAVDADTFAREYSPAP